MVLLGQNYCIGLVVRLLYRVVWVVSDLIFFREKREWKPWVITLYVPPSGSKCDGQINKHVGPPKELYNLEV